VSSMCMVRCSSGLSSASAWIMGAATVHQLLRLLLHVTRAQQQGV
jgi:hypothetical protein